MQVRQGQDKALTNVMIVPTAHCAVAEAQHIYPPSVLASKEVFNVKEQLSTRVRVHVIVLSESVWGRSKDCSQARRKSGTIEYTTRNSHHSHP